MPNSFSPILALVVADEPNYLFPLSKHLSILYDKSNDVLSEEVWDVMRHPALLLFSLPRILLFERDASVDP